MAPRKKVNKLTPHNDGKPRVMLMTKLTAVALTARGANPHADVTFFKSHKGDIETPTEKGYHGDLVALLTSVEAGHQHSVRVDNYDDHLYLDVGYAKSEGDEDSHYHSVTMNEDGTLVVSENAGHTHELSKLELQAYLTRTISNTLEYLAKHGNVTELDDSLSKTTAFKTIGENLMTVEEKLAKATKELAALKLTLKTAVKLGGLTDTEKSHHAKLGEDGQESFLGKSHTERNVDIEEALKADPVIYTTTDGVEFRKSDDKRMVDMAKQNDQLSKRLDSEMEAGSVAKLAKRAEEELGNVTGSVEARSAIIKSVDSIEDETLRGEAQTALKAMNTAAAGKFVAKGKGGPSSASPSGDAESQLDTLAKAHAKDNSMSFAKSYQAVLATPEGEALYNESVA